MADRDEGAVEVEAEVIEEGRELTVSFVPASIEANFDALERHVDALLAPYEGATYDLASEGAVRDAKRDRAYLNGVAKDIDERRKAVKREYMRPYDAFDSRATAIVAKVRAASSSIKAQLDEAEGRRREGRLAELREHYEGFAGLLAPVVPYERFHEDRWLNKTVRPAKAFEELDAKVERVAQDWEALREREGEDHYDLAERTFFSTLDLGAALSAARQAREEDERIAALREAVDASPGPAEKPAPPEPAEAPVEAPPAQAPAPAPIPAPAPVEAPPAPTPAPAPMPAPAPEPAPAPDAPRPWVVVVPSATRQDMERLAQVLRMAGVNGVVMQGTLAQAYEREAYGAR